MSVVDQYFEWANATGESILAWARPVGAPISITSVSSQQQEQWSYSDLFSASRISSLIEIIMMCQIRRGHLQTSVTLLRSLCFTSAS